MTNFQLSQLKLMIFCCCSLLSACLQISTSQSIFRPQKPECVYFTGAGMYFWWQAGAAKYIQQNCDLTNLPVIGASAGSLTATLLLSGADFDKAAETAFKLADSVNLYDRKTGLAGIWGALLKSWLEETIPDAVTADMLAPLEVAVTPPLNTPYLVKGFSGKADVIDACLASCHIPVFLDGRPFTEFRGEKVLDGSFWYFVTKDRFTGLPMPTRTNLEEIFWVDYTDDDIFMQSVSGNMVELASPSKVLEMMEDGYNFMKREHHFGRLPIAKTSKPPFVYVSELMSSVTKIPQQLQNLVLGTEAAEAEALGGSGSGSISQSDYDTVPVTLPRVKITKELAQAQQQQKEKDSSSSQSLKTRPKRERGPVSPSNRWIPDVLTRLAASVSPSDSGSSIPATEELEKNKVSSSSSSSSAKQSPKASQQNSAATAVAAAAAAAVGTDSSSSSQMAWLRDNVYDVDSIRNAGNVFMSWASDVLDATTNKNTTEEEEEEEEGTNSPVTVAVVVGEEVVQGVQEEDGWSVAALRSWWMSNNNQLETSV